MSDAAIDAMIAQIRAAGRIGPDGAREAAREIEASLKVTAGAGATPDGRAWELTKKGARAMANAAAAIAVRAVGTVVWIRLSGPEVFHHFGVRGARPRHVIPAGPLPQRLGEAVRRGFVTVWRRDVKGGGS